MDTSSGKRAIHFSRQQVKIRALSNCFLPSLSRDLDSVVNETFKTRFKSRLLACSPLQPYVLTVIIRTLFVGRSKPYVEHVILWVFFSGTHYIASLYYILQSSLVCSMYL